MHPNFHIQTPTPTEELSHDLLKQKGVRLFVKRDDLTHQEVMGNKWRKLKYNIQQMQAEGKNKVVTFGGARSNHIAAVAAAGKLFGFETMGIIRGDELNPSSNSTLSKANSDGMKMEFVSRNEYRKWREEPNEIKARFPDYYFLPEGGTNNLAIKGASEITQEIGFDFDYIACAIGTGGTFAGVISSLENHQKALGISALKGNFIHQEVKELLNNNQISNEKYSINTDFHFGGYGKITEELEAFINWFEQIFQIPLDPIYTGKCFYGIWKMIENDLFKENSRIILLHTGGLQGKSITAPVFPQKPFGAK